MSLKENVKAIKEELSAEEQFLESVIKAEGFWKKYKNIVIALVVALVLGLLIKAGMSYMHEQNIETSNHAYNTLMTHPDDASALATLKKSNPKMYSMYVFQQNIASSDIAVLEKIKGEIKDPILLELMTYHIASLEKKVSAATTDIAKDFALMQEGYLLLQNDKIKEANAKFSGISSNSSLQGLIANLKHYMGK